MTIKKVIDVLQHHQDAELLVRVDDENGDDILYFISGITLELDSEGESYRVILGLGDVV